jgi:hypothetical protein
MGCRAQMTAAGLWLAAALLPFRVAAQCPSGFLDAGEVSATAPAGKYQEVSVTKTLLLPKGIHIDESYRQTSIQAASDGGASDLRAGQIPSGLRLIPGGRSGGAWWSIANPKLEAMAKDGRGQVSQWRFQIDLYANTGGRAAPLAADVRVRICVKTQP